MRLATYIKRFLILFNEDGVVPFNNKVSISIVDERFGFMHVESKEIARELAEANGYKFLRPATFAKSIATYTELSKLGKIPKLSIWRKYFDAFERGDKE